MTSIIYLRTSTEEQRPENQIEDCKRVANKLGIVEYQVLIEKHSAFSKEDTREVFNKLKDDIMRNKINVLIVWDLDRIYRDRKKLVEFFQMCKIKNCKIYSFRQGWFEELEKIPHPFNEIMHNLMLQFMGWMAEEESRKKRERVLASLVRDENGIAKSKYGKVWGREPLTQKNKEEILELRKQGNTIRQIAGTIKISIGVVHKTIKENEKTLSTIN